MIARSTGVIDQLSRSIDDGNVGDLSAEMILDLFKRRIHRQADKIALHDLGNRCLDLRTSHHRAADIAVAQYSDHDTAFNGKANALGIAVDDPQCLPQHGIGTNNHLLKRWKSDHGETFLEMFFPVRLVFTKSCCLTRSADGIRYISRL